MTRTSKELLALAFALGFVACNKSNPPSVAFVSPVDGAVLTADAGTMANGLLTFALTAQVSNAPAGSTVDLLAKDKLVSGSTTPAPAGGSGEITISVTLSGGDPGTVYPLELDLDNNAGLELAKATISITVLLTSTGACTITISPPNGSLFNETGNAVQAYNIVQDEDLMTAGMQAKVTVSVGPPCADGMSVTLVAGTNAALTATLAGGQATFDAAPLPDTPVTALQDTTQLLGIKVTAAAGTGDESNAIVSYIVDSQQPTISITSPVDGAMLQSGSTIDVTGFTNIHQLPGTPVPVYLSDNGDAGVSVMLVPAGDGGFTEPPLTAPTGTNSLVVSVTGVTGNQAISGSPIVTILPSGVNCGDAGIPTVTFVSPTPDAGFNLAANEGPNTPPGLQTLLRINTSSMTGVAEFCSTVAPSAVGSTPCPFNPNLFEIGNPIPSSVPVSGGHATLDTATLGDDGAAANQTLTAQVTDGICGTQGEGSVTIEVHSIQPVIDSVAVQNTFGNPDAGCVWLNSENLQNGSAQTTVLVDVAAGDFGDGGPILTISTIGGATIQTDSAPLMGGAAEVPISLSDGTYTVSATITDVWGNQSGTDQFAICVKTSIPTCTITAPDPATGCFNIADNGGTAANGAVNVPIVVVATNASGLDSKGLPLDGTAAVTLNSAGAPTSDPIANAVSVSVSSAQGANVYSATVTDPAGNPAASCTPASLSVNVSTVGPTLTATPGATASGADANGCEIYLTRDGIPFTVTTTDVANGSVVSLVVTGANGGSSPKTSGTVTANSASISVSGVPNGVDSVTVTGADACGNPGTGMNACIDVQATGCDLSLVTPTATATDAGASVVFKASQVTDGGTASIELHTSCATGTQVDFTSTASGGSAQPQSADVDANGDVTFDLTGLVDGSSGTFTADISGGEALPTISYDAKLSLPTIGSETPVAGSLEIVAYQDNLILSDAGVTTLAVDGGTIVANEAQCDGTANACADFTISGISGLGPVDGNGNVGTATLTLNFVGGGTTNPNAITIANGTTSVTFSAVSLPAVATGTVTLTLTDNVGNAITETWNVTTDSLQPPAPALTAAMSNKRTASVKLSWTVPASNGDSATQGYQLAYVINNLQNAMLTATPSETTYASWTLDPTIAGVTGTTLTHVVSPPFATLNQYTFELRAIDAVGNRSPLAADATAVSVSSTDSNAWQTLTLLDPLGNGSISDFGYVLRVGDFNADGLEDLVITAPYQFASNPTPGIVYIFSGAADLSTVTTANAKLTSITLGGTDFDFFGQDAHVADYNGDGTDDLAVGSPEYNGGQGRVDIFFGVPKVGLPSSPSTTILGDSTTAGQFGFSVSSADVNGDGVADLIVGAPAMGSSNNGASYVFVGSKAAWPNPDAGADVTSATCVITGNAGDVIGAHTGTVDLGDIDGDGNQDIAIGAPGGGGSNGDAGSGSEYGFSGATLVGNATIDLSTTAGTQLLLFDLVGRVGGFCDPTAYGYNSGGFWACFGVDALDADFTGGKLNDLIVSSTQLQSIQLYTMAATGPVTPAAFGDGTEDEAAGGNVGWSMVASDISGDGAQDLLAGQNNSGSPNVYLYLNTGTGLTTFTTATGGELFGPDGGFFGYSVAAGAFQGAAAGQDFAVSDIFFNDSAYVNVYY